MAYSIFIDTNYFRSFKPQEFSETSLPSKLEAQLLRAHSRGDLICIPRTVQLETDAWLQDESNKRHQAIFNKIMALVDEGYTVEPKEPHSKTPIDLLSALRRVVPDASVIVPTLSQFEDAERRTCYRIKPNPDKNGEEFRDRLIWCQMVDFSRITPSQILMVSNDSLFANGVMTTEGRVNRIQVARGQDELDQRLGEVSHAVNRLLSRLAKFLPSLASRSITIDLPKMVVESLRKRRLDGYLTESFVLGPKVFVDGEEAPPFYSISMTSIGERPEVLRLNRFNSPTLVEITLPSNNEDETANTAKAFSDSEAQKNALNDIIFMHGTRS